MSFQKFRNLLVFILLCDLLKSHFHHDNDSFQMLNQEESHTLYGDLRIKERYLQGAYLHNLIVSNLKLSSN